MSAASDEMAARIRAILGARPDVVEKKMFGGVGFMLNGNMLAGSTAKGALMVRVSPEGLDTALARPGASVMHMGDKPMKGFISVADEGIETDEALADWLAFSEGYVRTLPAK
ncbi:TfoX/Sxy family protein [Paradevosia shaoguanensis]|uniref:TfoX/Sxy family protein n=1 Tax=Paradevosia shaoguanensis TaxID=1335043 RepID=A0AA41QMK5_9HYPH|nr:TfoX/Sxy family protein [Paradevosia shaoguanensis]MCF1743152.1 TfoX/Sxy family protein [Paradevosia shaoguanensis]MCI0127635.1 TfoX/Sxy family protein [Paradevosia shaoguanensis]